MKNKKQGAAQGCLQSKWSRLKSSLQKLKKSVDVLCMVCLAGGAMTVGRTRRKKMNAEQLISQPARKSSI